MWHDADKLNTKSKKSYHGGAHDGTFRPFHPILPETAHTSPDVRAERGQEVENVVGQADQAPLCLHSLKPSQKEGSSASGPFDLSEDRLNALLAFGVGLLPFFCLELATHPIHHAHIVGNPAFGAGEGLSACFVRSGAIMGSM